MSETISMQELLARLILFAGLPEPMLQQLASAAASRDGMRALVWPHGDSCCIAATLTQHLQVCAPRAVCSGLAAA